MAREKMFDPTFQKVFTEAILKENDNRRKWHLKYGGQHGRSGAVHWDKDPDGDEKDNGTTCLCRTLPQRKMPPREEGSWPPSGPLDTQTTIPRVHQPPQVMKRVPHSSRRLIYQGLSHDGEGRAMYLRQRVQKTPMERYHFPLVSSWEYGWHYGQHGSHFCPRHGRF